MIRATMRRTGKLFLDSRPQTCAEWFHEAALPHDHQARSPMAGLSGGWRRFRERSTAGRSLDECRENLPRLTSTHAGIASGRGPPMPGRDVHSGSDRGRRDRVAAGDAATVVLRQFIRVHSWMNLSRSNLPRRSRRRQLLICSMSSRVELDSAGRFQSQNKIQLLH